MRTDVQYIAAITRQKNIWCWHLTACDSSALPSWVEGETPYSAFDKILPSYFKMHGWPSRKWGWQHISIYCSPSSTQNHMSLKNFSADELPIQVYEMENTKVTMKTKSTFTKYQDTDCKIKYIPLIIIHYQIDTLKSLFKHNITFAPINNKWAKH